MNMNSDTGRGAIPPVQPEEFGECSVLLQTDHEEAPVRVRDVFGAVGFSFPTEFSPAEQINAGRDADPGRGVAGRRRGIDG
jgi:hypothetical protein